MPENYQSKLEKIAKVIKDETAKIAAKPAYLTREMLVLMKVHPDQMPANDAHKQKQFFLAHALDIFGCRKIPDEDTINNTLGSLTEEIYSQSEINLAYQMAQNLKITRTKANKFKDIQDNQHDVELKSFQKKEKKKKDTKKFDKYLGSMLKNLSKGQEKKEQRLGEKKPNTNLNETKATENENKDFLSQNSDSNSIISNNTNEKVVDVKKIYNLYKKINNQDYDINQRLTSSEDESGEIKSKPENKQIISKN